MGATVAMRYPIIQAAISQFKATEAALRLVAAAAEAIATALEASFFGAVFFAEVIRRMHLINQKATKLADLNGKFADNLGRAMKDHKSGDYAEGSYFSAG